MKKIILFFMVIFVLFLLIHSSFLGKNTNSFQELEKIEIKKGIYNFDIIDGNFVYGDANNSGSLKINHINTLDKVLYDGEINIDNSNINLGKGVYLINIVDLNSSYIINGPGFQIKNTGPTNIFIDSSGIRTNIFSLNNIVNLKLYDDSTKEVVNNINLYPHMYIKFTPTLNKNIKGADILKLTQWFPVDYFGEQIINSDGVNKNFITQIIGENNSKLDEIEKMFFYLNGNGDKDEKYIELIKNNNFGTLMGEKFMKEYSKIFLNEAKKLVYNKNLIIRTIGDLINQKSEDPNKEIKFILDTMKEIKKENTEDYNEMKNIIYFYSDIIISENSDIDLKSNFSLLYNSLEGKNINNINSYIINLNNIYQNLDFQKNKTETEKYNNMYIELSKINKELISEELDDNEKSYLVLYLNNIILDGFNLNVDVNNIIKNFNNYINISVQYYSSNDELRIRTGVAEYSKVLNELLDKIRYYFFQADRNQDGLLLINKSNSISTPEVSTLENNINWIFSYFNNNKDKLWDKEKSTYVSNFEKAKKLSEEYILALKDYNIYIANTKEQDWELLFGDEKDTLNQTLSKENAISYLKQFNYLNISDIKVSLRDKNYCEYKGEDVDVKEGGTAYCYKIENVFLNNSIKLNFILIPSDYNRISNISINGDSNKNKGSYRLDQEKEKWKKLYENYSGSDSAKYDFKNYFLYTFGENGNIIVENNDNKTQTQTGTEAKDETATIKAFKSILLGKGGELNKLSGFITASYNNVIVEELEGSYDIYINNAEFEYRDNNLGKNFYGNFSSKYIHSPQFVFQNPEITLKDGEGNNLLLGNKIIFNGVFKTKSFETNIKQFFNNYDNLSNILNIINNYLSINKATIYINNISENKITVEGTNIKIIIDGYLIKSINSNGKEILGKEVSSFQLENTLKSLN